jgi:hypothetical protein
LAEAVHEAGEQESEGCDEKRPTSGGRNMQCEPCAVF